MILVSALIGAGIVAALWAVREHGLSFVAQRPEDYADTEPRFIPQVHLNGPIACEGVIYGPMGRVVSRFEGDFEGMWDGKRGILKEHFRYAKGDTQDREWTLTFEGDKLKAEAPDLVGTGEGVLSGSTLRLKYKIRLEEDSGGHVLSVTDWLYLSPDGKIVNRSQFRKFGIRVAELVAVMRPKDMG